jgi:hypothetical protein
MSIPELIKLMEAHLAALNTARATAAAIGDITQVTRLDSDAMKTQATLDQLRTLQAL